MDLKQLLNQTTIGKGEQRKEEQSNEEQSIQDLLNEDSEYKVTVDHLQHLEGQTSDYPIEEDDQTPLSVNTTTDTNTDDTNTDTNTDDTDDNNQPIIDARFAQPWNKLEKGSKMNRILLYVKKEKEDNDLSDILAKQLKNLLFKGCESGLFNKISDVKYNQETGFIESFKNLEFNESTKKYKLKTGGTKNRSVSKSRSNIDRLTKKK